jgi:hypothetical protein
VARCNGPACPLELRSGDEPILQRFQVAYIAVKLCLLHQAEPSAPERGHPQTLKLPRGSQIS